MIIILVGKELKSVNVTVPPVDLENFRTNTPEKSPEKFPD